VIRGVNNRIRAISGTIFIISLVVMFICIGFNELDGYRWLFLLPITYAVSFALAYIQCFTKLCGRYKFGLVLYLFNIALFLKYVLTPLAMIFQQQIGTWGSAYGKWGPTPTDAILTAGILIECVEIIFAFSIMCLMLRKYAKKSGLEIILERKPFNNKAFIIGFCAVAFTYIVLISPSALSLNNIFQATPNDAKELTHAGIVVVFKQIFLISVYLLFNDLIYRKLKSNRLKMFLSFSCLIIYLSLIMSMSRWNLIFTAITGCYLLYVYYGKDVKNYILVLSGIVAIGFISISVLKFSYTIASNAPLKQVLGMLFGQMQDYFSGPRLVAQSICVKSEYSNSIGLNTIVNDLFGNVPLISAFFNQDNRINVYFCHYNFGDWTNRSLLMPMIGEGYCYLPFFPWFLSIFYIIITMKFDYLAQKEHQLELKYLYVLEGCWLAFSLCLNSQTNWGHFIQVFIMTWIVFKVNKKIVIRRRNI